MVRRKGNSRPKLDLERTDASQNGLGKTKALKLNGVSSR